MVTVHIESMVRLDTRELPKRVVRSLLRATKHRDPLYGMRKRQGLPTEDLPRHILTHRQEPPYLFLWRGVLGTVVRLLKAAGVAYRLVDERLRLPAVDLSNTITLRPYQEPPAAVMRRRQQTVGQGPAGSGKTELLLHVAAHFRQPTLVLVWQERQQQTWIERIPNYFSFEPGGVGGAFKELKLAPITVGLVQTVRNRMEEMRGLFGCVICDEVSRFAAPTLSEVVNNLPARIRLGASDDERRRDGREFLLYDTFGPRGWKLSPDAGQCPVDVLLVPTGFVYSGVDYSTTEWTDVIDELIEDEDRNELIVGLARRSANDGGRVLIWSDRVDHCRDLKGSLLVEGHRAGLLLGGKPQRKEADETTTGLRDGTVEVGIGTVVAEQSINIPALDTGIMTCASADQKLYRFRQMRGRLARPSPETGKVEARLFYIWDHLVPGLKRKARNINRRYAYRVLRLPKEYEAMAEKVAVTVKTLKEGCKQLGITIPAGATQKKLERLIERELAKDKTFGSYACGACFRDIPDKISPCPWCAAKFKPLPEEEVEEVEEELEDEELEEGEEDEEGEELEEDEEDEEGEGEDDDEEAEDDADDDEDGDEFVGDDDDDDDDDADADDDDDAEEEEFEEEEEEFEEEEFEEEEFEEDEPEEEPEPEPKPKKKSKRQKAPAQKQREAAREQKREQIKTELPYTDMQLTAMKRTTLVMVAGVLGIKDPLKIGSSERLVKAILISQKKKYKTDDKGRVASKKKSKKKKSKKPAAKKAKAPAAAPAKKKAKGKKKRSR